MKKEMKNVVEDRRFRDSKPDLGSKTSSLGDPGDEAALCL